ncbi:right-handed parallel beta-helix repeat-containing protein [Candidatus Zixiibacteriota bacterium]
MGKMSCVMGIIVLLMVPVMATADGLFHHPESVVFDSLRNRYLVANFDDGNIIAIDSEGQQSVFASPGGNSLGSVIVRDTLYVTQLQSVIGFDLATAEPVFDLLLSSTPYLEGITSDGLDYLYVVHDAGRVYQVRISDQSFTLLVSSGLPLLQDLQYDGANNRLLAVQLVAGVEIKAVDLTNGSLSTVVPTTFGLFDGITMDNEGYVYVATQYGDGHVYRFDPDFSEPPLLFADNLLGPANLHYNRRDSIVAIPSIYDHTVTFWPDIYKLDSDFDGLVDVDDNCPYHPNPGQEDLDNDSVGNACDVCPEIYNPTQGDIDGDGIGDSCETRRTWYVHPEGLGDFLTIQAAIDSLTHGDTLLVADGLYAGESNSGFDFAGRQGINLRSENGPQFTIIDCAGSAVEPRRAFTFENNEDSTFTIDGFTIRNGYGPEYSATSSGGAIFCYIASPLIRNCVFTGNTAALGGALFTYRSEPRLINCTFADNSATQGAATFLYASSSAIFENCLIAFNLEGQSVVCNSGSEAEASCSDVYGNAGGDWVGGLSGQLGVDGNFSADPLFCNVGIGDVGLVDESSPCMPANNDCGVLIGALGVGCACNCGIAGDMDCSSEMNPLDVAFLVNFVYLSQDALCDHPNCTYPVGDLDCDSEANPLDVVYLVNAVYLSRNAICDGCAP